MKEWRDRVLYGKHFYSDEKGYFEKRIFWQVVCSSALISCPDCHQQQGETALSGSKVTPLGAVDDDDGLQKAFTWWMQFIDHWWMSWLIIMMSNQSTEAKHYGISDKCKSASSHVASDYRQDGGQEIMWHQLHPAFEVTATSLLCNRGASQPGL